MLKRYLSFLLAVSFLLSVSGCSGALPKNAQSVTGSPTTRFIVMADSRGKNAQDYINTSEIQKILGKIKNLELQPEFAVMIGDLVHGPISRTPPPGSTPSPEQYTKVKKQLKDFKDVVTGSIPGASASPYPAGFYFPGIGNHESRQYDATREGMMAFEDVFKDMLDANIPQNQYYDTEHYYRTVYYFDRGNTRIFMLNNCVPDSPAPTSAPVPSSYYTIPDDELAWVESNIDPSKKHNIFCMHAPLYTTPANEEIEPDEAPGDDVTEKHKASQNGKLWHLLADESVQGPIVFCGHQHFYSRLHKTVLIDKNKTKTIYQVTTGTFGAPMATPNPGEPIPTPGPGITIDHKPDFRYQFAVVDVSDDQLKVVVYDDSGNQIDSFAQ